MLISLSIPVSWYKLKYEDCSSNSGDLLVFILPGILQILADDGYSNIKIDDDISYPSFLFHDAAEALMFKMQYL